MRLRELHIRAQPLVAFLMNDYAFFFFEVPSFTRCAINNLLPSMIYEYHAMYSRYYCHFFTMVFHYYLRADFCSHQSCKRLRKANLRAAIKMFPMNFYRKRTWGKFVYLYYRTFISRPYLPTYIWGRPPVCPSNFANGQTTVQLTIHRQETFNAVNT